MKTRYDCIVKKLCQGVICAEGRRIRTSNADTSLACLSTAATCQGDLFIKRPFAHASLDRVVSSDVPGLRQSGHTRLRLPGPKVSAIR